MYKEYRAPTLNNAVSQMYIDMAGRHQARGETIQIIKHSVVSDKNLKRSATIGFNSKDCRFPKTDNRKRAPLAGFKTTFKANRPTLAWALQSKWTCQPVTTSIYSQSVCVSQLAKDAVWVSTSVIWLTKMRSIKVLFYYTLHSNL